MSTAAVAWLIAEADASPVKQAVAFFDETGAAPARTTIRRRVLEMITETHPTLADEVRRHVADEVRQVPDIDHA